MNRAYALNGRKLRNAREAAGRSAEETAIAVNRTVSTLFRWETNRVEPPPAVVRSLARFLGVAIADICDDAYPTLKAVDQAKQSLDEYVTGVVKRSGDLTPEQRVQLARLFPASDVARPDRRRIAA